MKPKRSKSKSRLHRPDKSNTFRDVQNTPSHLQGKLCPTNLQEEKDKFMTLGITPQFKWKESVNLDRVANTKRGQIRFDLFDHAKTILDLVKEKYGDDEQYSEVAYGKPIDHIQATKILQEYINENNVVGEMTVYWAADLTASARMMWRGPSQKYNRPEARKYSLIIKSTHNSFLREHGIRCLADHEIGTHFFRMVNDGFQPWFSERKKFGLGRRKTREHNATEEGLAFLNTVINAKSKYLHKAALLYYTACKAVSMGFKELYDHLATYVRDRESRWKHVMRVKRSLPDPGAHGGYGNDQCYFEGAVKILQNVDNIDFNVLYSGSVCVDELDRIKRIARLDCIHIPKFMKDVEQYKRKLRYIAYLNQIIPKPELPKHTSRGKHITAGHSVQNHVMAESTSADISQTSQSLILHRRFLQDSKSNRYTRSLNTTIHDRMLSTNQTETTSHGDEDEDGSGGNPHSQYFDSDHLTETDDSSDEDCLPDYESCSRSPSSNASQMFQMPGGSCDHSISTCKDQDAKYEPSRHNSTLPSTALIASSTKSSTSRRLLSRPQSSNKSLLSFNSSITPYPLGLNFRYKK